MVSKRKANNISGWLLVDKPPGITSTGVVNKVKWAFNAKKVGHAGTLDPDATGVLPIALGEATKIIPYIMDEIKSYQFCVKFGEATDTDDATGKIVQNSSTRPSDDEISTRLKKYIGNETFLLTYGDAVTDLNIKKVVNYHKSHGKMVTITGVRPPARFGELTINQNNEVLEFKKRALPGTLMGDNVYCDIKIKNKTLHVKGNISVFGNNWHDTKDIVVINKNKEFYIKGRSK